MSDEDQPTAPDDDGLELFRDPAEGEGGERESADPAAVPSMGPSTKRSQPPRVERLTRRVLAVSGAKGGVGKSLIATNLAIYLATIGRRVVVVDADSSGATLHTFLGVERPPFIASYVPPMPSFRLASDDGQQVEVAAPPVDPKLLEPPEDPETDGESEGEKGESGLSRRFLATPIPGLSLLHAGIDEPPRGSRRRTSLRDLMADLRALDVDYIVVDLGAGTRPALLDFWLAADLSLFVSLPEPTAIENTYRFVRAAFCRYIRNLVEEPEDRRRLVRAMRRLGNHPAPLDLARRLELEKDSLAPIVREAMESFRFRMVFNQTRLRADLELGDRMRTAALRRLGLHLEYLGYVDSDDTVWTCVRSRRPLLVESPGTKASKSIEKIARRLLAIDAGKGRRRMPRTAPPDTHHDLLEVERGATDEEIRRAYKRAKEVYAPDALPRYGLFDEAGLEALRVRLEEAYDVLLDPARRRPYEMSVFPDNRPPEPEKSEKDEDKPKPPAPTITPETEFTGPLIRAVRESQGIDLSEISNRTKVSTFYLNAIEEDDFGDLPAAVYVRGFVTEVAKYLRLDPEQVSRTYTKRFRRHLEEQEKL